MYCEEYEKNLIEEMMQKRLMNGSVVLMEDTPKKNRIEKELASWQSVFYDGDPLTDFEVDVQRMYLGQKLYKHSKYEKRKSMRFKVRWTISDLNRYQD